MNRVRLLALARKVVDESSTEPERVTSGRMLALEILRLSEEEWNAPASKPMSTTEQAAADLANSIVRNAVARAEAKAAPPTPESPSTWVEFDPPAPARDASTFGGEFGKPPRRRR